MRREGVAFCFSALQGLAAAIYIAKEALPWLRARGSDKVRTFNALLRRPILLVLVGGFLLTLGLGCWFASHPAPITTAIDMQTGVRPNPTSAPSLHAQAASPTQESRTVPPKTISSVSAQFKGISNGQKLKLSGQAVPPSVSIPGSVNQTTNAPCSGNSVTGSVDNTGCTVGNVPPPARTIQPMGRDAALELLRSAPSGSSVYFVIVGGSGEIRSFESEIEELFIDAGWTVAGRGFVGHANITVYDGNSLSSSQGEGLQCRSGGPSGEIALKAMKIAGYPCSGGFVMAHAGSADFYVQVGTRIPPQD